MGVEVIILGLKGETPEHVDETATDGDVIVDDPTVLPYSFSSANELLSMCKASGLSISALMMENEKSWRPEAEIHAGLLNFWKVMDLVSLYALAVNEENAAGGGLAVNAVAVPVSIIEC